MFPDIFLSGTDVQAEKIWMIDAAIFKFERVFVAVWNFVTGQSICNYYLGF